MRPRSDEYEYLASLEPGTWVTKVYADSRESRRAQQRIQSAMHRRGVNIRTIRTGQNLGIYIDAEEGA